MVGRAVGGWWVGGRWTGGERWGKRWGRGVGGRGFLVGGFGRPELGDPLVRFSQQFFEVYRLGVELGAHTSSHRFDLDHERFEVAPHRGLVLQLVEVVPR